MATVYWDPGKGPWRGRGKAAAETLGSVLGSIEQPVPVASIAEVVTLVESGRADVGFVPLEDSASGLHDETVDAMVFSAGDVVVIGEVDLVDAEMTTRWVGIGREQPGAVAGPQTLVFAIPILNRPGTLQEVLAAFSSRGINLNRFWPRPLHGVLGMYGFLLEFEGSPVDPWVADALADVLSASSHMKFLGTFPAGRREWAQVTGRVPAGADLRSLSDLDRLVSRLASAGATPPTGDAGTDVRADAGALTDDQDRDGS